MSVQIEVTDLHKTYGKNEVLKGISAKLPDQVLPNHLQRSSDWCWKYDD